MSDETIIQDEPVTEPVQEAQSDAKSAKPEPKLCFFLFSTGEYHNNAEICVTQYHEELLRPDQPALLAETLLSTHEQAKKRSKQEKIRPVCVVTDIGSVLMDAPSLGLTLVAHKRDLKKPENQLTPPEKETNLPTQAIFVFTSGEFNENCYTVTAEWTEAYLNKEDPEILLQTIAKAQLEANQTRGSTSTINPKSPLKFLAMVDNNGRMITNSYLLGMIALTAIKITGTQPTHLEMALQP